MSADVRTGPDLRVLDGIASWCGGLHGSMPLPDALRALAEGLGADAAAISRHHHRSEDQPRTVAVYPGASARSEAALKRAMCVDVLGYLFGRTRPATVWYLSELQDDPAWSPSEALMVRETSRGLREIAVIPLTQTAQTADYIEFHFNRDLPRSALLEIEALVPTIVRSWSGRRPGLVTQATVNDRLADARAAAASGRPDWSVPILGEANPADLSRSEFRVCLLLSRGLSVKAVAEELRLSENTVRSHLRAIYAKTETSSLAELLYRILSAGQEPETARVQLRGA